MPEPGCYGVQLRGTPDAAAFCGVAGSDWPVLSVLQRVGTVDWTGERIGPDRAKLFLSGRAGTAVLDRQTRSVELEVERHYRDEELLHPLLSGSFAIVNRWLGRDAFHAGAVVIGGRAWVVTGSKGMGKSTTLALLALRGMQVLTDDLLVEQDGSVFGGPSFVDLRPDAADQLGIGRDMGLLGARERARFDLPAAPPATTELGGWISLAWADDVSLTPVPVAGRLRMLFENRAVFLEPVDPSAFVRHAALPSYVLGRPRDWSAIGELIGVLVERLAG